MSVKVRFIVEMSALQMVTNDIQEDRLDLGSHLTKWPIALAWPVEFPVPEGWVECETPNPEPSIAEAEADRELREDYPAPDAPTVEDILEQFDRLSPSDRDKARSVIEDRYCSECSTRWEHE